MNNIKGSLILLLTAFIWGTAFVAQTSGAGAVGTFTFNAARSIVGALFLAVVIIIKNVLDKRNNSGKVISTENESRLQTWPLGAGIICGIVPAVWNKCISTRGRGIRKVGLYYSNLCCYGFGSFGFYG